MKLSIIFVALVCILLLFLLVGERIALNMFRKGMNELMNVLLVDAVTEDSLRIINIDKLMISAFRRKKLRKNELKALSTMVDTVMIDSVISNEERDKILQFMEMLVRG
ncbi:hypothetical protein KAT73_00620 [candidate division WOR-3 bacterium]|nr:hypothetical protein [candidate division WOR-3 bacterium]